jgi:hypothetical protein
MQWPEALARAAVERWERSKAFHVHVADRPVRIRFDDKQFPSAWAPGGHDEREAILAAVAALAKTGLAEVRRTGRGMLSTVHAFVLAADAVEAAYQELDRLHVSTRRSRARAFLAYIDTLPRNAAGWTHAYLARVTDDLGQGRFHLLGRGAHEESNAREVEDALRALVIIAGNAQWDERSMSGELFGNTKRLRDVRPRVRQMLLMGDPHWKTAPRPTERRIWSHYGEVFKPPFTAVAANLKIEGVVDLALFKPYAALPRAVLLRIANTVAASNLKPVVTTIENETAFLRYLDEDDVPTRIDAGTEIVLYTEGFPSDDLLQLLRDLAPHVSGVRHWGDSDVYGIRIAEMVGLAAGCVSLFRTDAAWVLEQPPRLGQQLDSAHKLMLDKLREHCEAPHVVGASEVATAVLLRGLWFEQEVYYASAALVVAG